jgi:hypothetical protein
VRGPIDFGCELSFQCFTSEGAILTLPDGAFRQDLRNLMSFREYAVRNAEAWYKYVNGPRGREAANGSIYLVTGCDKGKSWGVASFCNAAIRESFSLAFTAAAVGGVDAGHTYYWGQSAFATTRAGPMPLNNICDRAQNQCTFIRGFKISLGEGAWTKLFRPVEVSKIVDATADDILSKSSFVPFRDGTSWLSGLFYNSGGRSSRGNEQASDSPDSEERGSLDPGDGVIVVSDFPPTSEVRAMFIVAASESDSP